MTMPWRAAGRWTVWLALLVGLTVVLSLVRERIDPAHVLLAFLLVVLGGSASGGRALGLTLALLSFGIIDYVFQPPFDQFTIGKPLDWLSLIAFLSTSFVATQLLARARAEAEAARRRTVEVASLGRLGSEALSAGRADEALVRIAGIVQSTLGVAECAIFPWTPAGGFGARVTRDGMDVPATAPDELVRRVVVRGEPVAVAEGELVESPSQSVEAVPVVGPHVRTLLLPLRVQGRVVGVLRLADDAPLTFDAAKRRFLDALTYYAALGVERVHLVAEAEHAEALREADRFKDTLLASVSHDLRTPLTTIKALAQSAALRGDEAAAAIEEQADRLARLVSDLLDLSRIRGRTFALSPELNTAEDLMGAAVRQAQGLLSGKSLRAVVDLDSPALVGRFDFSQSLRILGNLVENAIRHSPAAEPVELSARREGEMLVFTVADRGPGVPAADAERIFDSFYRARNATPDTGHAGLGLAIARQLAELQGGSLAYQPRAGGGSLFVLRLPAVEVDEATFGG